MKPFKINDNWLNFKNTAFLISLKKTNPIIIIDYTLKDLTNWRVFGTASIIYKVVSDFKIASKK